MAKTKWISAGLSLLLLLGPLAPAAQGAAFSVSRDLPQRSLARDLFPPQAEGGDNQTPPAEGEPDTGGPSSSGEGDGQNPPAEGEPATGGSHESGGENGKSIPHYQESLGPRTIAAGEEVSYTTISSKFPSSPGYYPGQLTLSVTGPVVIQEGGSLLVGTLSLSGPEASPVIAGQRQEGGVILVKAGGRLKLTQAVFDTTGSGPLIVQEPGGIVELANTPVEEGLIQWSVPLVDNQGDDPEDLWLPEGTLLTGQLLPATLTTTLLDQGQALTRELSLAWDLSGYDGSTQEGELTLTGSFLDGEGQPLLSACPLTLTVHWYRPQTLAVSQAVWKGNLSPLVQMGLEGVPDSAQLWGEVSTDGAAWQAWDQTFLIQDTNGRLYFNFQLEDDTYQFFRVHAWDPLTDQRWQSAAYHLTPEGTEDAGGNRGGAVSPFTPSREPERPEEEILQPESSLPAAAAPAPLQEETQPALEEESSPAREDPPVGEDPPASQEEEPPPPAQEPAEAGEEPFSPQPLPLQGLLAAAGLGVCAFIWIVVARRGSPRKKP